MFNVVVRKRNKTTNNILTFMIFTKAYGKQVVEKLAGMNVGDYIKVIGALQAWDGKTYLQAYDVITTEQESLDISSHGTPISAAVTDHMGYLKDAGIQDNDFVSSDDNFLITDIENSDSDDDNTFDKTPDTKANMFDDYEYSMDDDDDDDDDDITYIENSKETPNLSPNSSQQVVAPQIIPPQPVQPTPPKKIVIRKKKKAKDWRERLKE